jgi:hypothetical protein
VHHSFILGFKTRKRIYDAFWKKSFSPVAQCVSQAPYPKGGARLRLFFKTLFSELERRDIIVSFWEVKLRIPIYHAFLEEVVLSG